MEPLSHLARCVGMPKKHPAPKKYVPPAPPGYRDVFDIRSSGKGPLILSDNTSVEWPRGWTQADAARWRKASGLARPS